MLQLVREEDSAGAEELYKAATYQGLFPRWIIRKRLGQIAQHFFRFKFLGVSIWDKLACVSSEVST